MMLGISPVLINMHAVIPASRVNGPGCRTVVFFQGCQRRCTGCFNPDTHSMETRELYAPEEVFVRHLRPGVEGITVSGGEPFLQPVALGELLKIARNNYSLSTVVYTGFSYDDLCAVPECVSALQYVDVLIDCAYIEDMKEPTLLARGSTNQNFFFLSDRYSVVDFYMPGKAEIVIGADGLVTGTGFSRFIRPQ